MDRILAPGPFLRAIIEAFRVSYLKQGQWVSAYVP